MENGDFSRRKFLKMLAAGGLVLISGCRQPGRPGTPSPEVLSTAPPSPLPTATPLPAPSPTPPPTAWEPPTQTRLTPVEDFYTMKYHPTPPPEVNLDEYRLIVEGMVDNPLALSLDDLKAFPAINEMRTLECISNPVGGTLIGNTTWTGLSMAALLEEAGVQPGGRHLKLESLDGYHTGIPLALAQEEHSLLVYQMNGQPLPAKHGYPLRALWPGRYGQKQPKWLQRITVQRQPHVGHFEGQGWSDDAFIKPTSRIEQPPKQVVQQGSFYVAGIAFTGAMGLQQVDVSLDNGLNWQPAQLLPGPSPLVWTLWWLPVDGLEQGVHQVLARVTDHAGNTQSRPARNSNLLAGTFPDGTDEMHRIVVQVVEK